MSTTTISRNLGAPAGLVNHHDWARQLLELLLERLPGRQQRERFSQVLARYRTLPYEIRYADSNRGACELIDGIVDAASLRPPSWEEIQTAERAVLTMLSGEDLKEEAKSLRAEFQSAAELLPADKPLLEAYRNSRPPELADCGETELRADVLALHGRLHSLYASRRLQLQTRNSIALWTGILSVLAIIFTLKVDTIFHLDTMVFDVAGVGMLGGLFSTLLRVQKFKLVGAREAASITEAGSRLTVILAPAIGGAGAVVLFVLLISGFLQGSFLPVLPTVSFAPDTDYLEALFNMAIPSSMDAAKLYLLCFLAGFSERLVPDMMSRLAAIAEKQRD